MLDVEGHIHHPQPLEWHRSALLRSRPESKEQDEVRYYASVSYSSLYLRVLLSSLS
jgi:hypothetical protein